jgi:8-oxo-dGTP pyrophosphatase MutT (NUDIX family)
MKRRCGIPHFVRRELSAGGVVVRRMRGRLWFAAVRPQGKALGTWALPKGLVDEGEAVRETAVREVAEETGLRTAIVAKLGDTKYTYTWDGERIFKVVSFFLLRPLGGRLGVLPPGMDAEVAEARWLRLDDPGVMAYRGEREMVERARALYETGASGHPSR